MQYYSKSPDEFRRRREEDLVKEGVKKKKSFFLQAANMGILMAAIFLMLKVPGLVKPADDKKKLDTNSPVENHIDWKEWSISSLCTPRDACVLTLAKKAPTTTPDAFFWEIKDPVTGESLLKSFELIPKDVKPGTEKKFTLSIGGFKTDFDVELHFMSAKNEEVLMMKVYP